MTTPAQRPPGTRRRTATMAVAAAVTAPVLWAVDPATTRLPLCPLHAATGLWCPLCGGLRATHALLHGDLGAALSDNALCVLGIPVLAWLWLRYYRPSGSRATRRRLPRPAVAALVVLAMIFGIVRNLPAGSWLAPPG